MTRYYTATAGAALAVTMSIGLSSAPAQAAPNLSISSHLTIEPSPSDPGSYHTAVIGVVTMSQAAAQDSINHRYSVQLRYWGDDEFSDDLLHGPLIAPNMFADADGLHYQYNVTLAASVLNEDNTIVDSVSDAQLDEIYVGAHFVAPDGKSVSQVESNRIVHVF